MTEALGFKDFCFLLVVSCAGTYFLRVTIG